MSVTSILLLIPIRIRTTIGKGWAKLGHSSYAVLSDCLQLRCTEKVNLTAEEVAKKKKDSEKIMQALDVRVSSEIGKASGFHIT